MDSHQESTYQITVTLVSITTSHSFVSEHNSQRFKCISGGNGQGNDGVHIENGEIVCILYCSLVSGALVPLIRITITDV